MSEVIRPMRAFFDTNHLVNLHRVRSGGSLAASEGTERHEAYLILAELIGSGRLLPLFFESQSYEWIHGKPESLKTQIASVLDSAPSVLSMLPDPEVFLVEGLNEAKRIDPNIDYPGFEIVEQLGGHNSLGLWMSAHSLTDAKPEWRQPVETGSVKDFVMALADAIRGRSAEWREGISGDAFALEVTRKTQKKNSRLDDATRRGWFQSAHNLQGVLRSIGASLDPGEIIQQIDLEKCPATVLRVETVWKFAKSNRKHKQNDMTDLAMLAPLAYADVALIEKSLHDCVRQTGLSGYMERVHRDVVSMVEYVARRDELG